MNLTCANCEELIVTEPVHMDGRSFCCSGCADGGPCICTYRDLTGADDTGYSAPMGIAAEPQPQPLAWPAPERAPAKVVRRPSILRVSGLRNQLELLLLGQALEGASEIEELSLVRADLDDVWFSVSTSDSDALAEALVRLPGFEVDARPHPAGVDATIRMRSEEEAAQEEIAAAVPAVAPTRSRFRLFQRNAELEAAPVGGPFDGASAPSAPHTVDAVASAPAPVPAPHAEPVYEAPAASVAPAPTYEPPAPVYQPPAPVYEAPAPAYQAPQPTYEPAPAPRTTYYEAPAPAYAAPAPEFSRPSEPVPPPPAPVQYAPPVEPAYAPPPPPPPAPAPAPVPIRPVEPPRSEPNGMLTADMRPGGAVAMREHITVVAYPFRSFVTLNEFQDAMRALHGVINVKVRRFYRGTLHLGVEYEDVIPLSERLRDLQGFAWRLIQSSPQEIELSLEEQGDLVSSG